MRITDRYVLKTFLLALASSAILLGGLYVAMSALENIDDLVSFGKRVGATRAVFVGFRYYAASVVHVTASFAEVLALAAAVATAAVMARSNEFVALLAAGVSLRRLAFPVVAASAVVGVLAFSLQCLFGPALVRSEQMDKRRIYGLDESLGSSLSIQGLDGETAVVLSVENWDSAARRSGGFAAAFMAPQGGFSEIRAPCAVWDRRGGKWLFPDGGRRWEYGGEGSLGVASVTELESGLGPDLLEAETLGVEVLGLRSLARQRGRPEYGAALHFRLARLLSPVVLVFLVLPFGLVTDPRRAASGAVICIAVGIGYELAAHMLFRAASSGSLPAWLGGWAVPVTSGGVGAFLNLRMRT